MSQRSKPALPGRNRSAFEWTNFRSWPPSHPMKPLVKPIISSGQLLLKVIQSILISNFGSFEKIGIKAPAVLMSIEARPVGTSAAVVSNSDQIKSFFIIQSFRVAKIVDGNSEFPFQPLF